MDSTQPKAPSSRGNRGSERQGPKSGPRRRLLAQILVLVAVALVTVGLTVHFLHRSEISQEKVRLHEVARSLARLLEVNYREHLGGPASPSPQEASSRAVGALARAQEEFAGFGETGEVVLAEMREDSLVLLLAGEDRRRSAPEGEGAPGTLRQLPMGRALAGEGGSMVTPDYRGEKVVAAFEPVAMGERTVGLVVKMDVAELRIPLVAAALRAGGVALLVIILGAVTIRRLGEPALRAAEEIREAEEWREVMIEGSRDAIFVSDEDSRFVLVNRAAGELTGYTREQLLSMKIPDLHQEMDLDAYRQSHDSILAGHDALTEAPILRKDGAKIDTEFNNRRITVGDRTYMHTVARDVTERRALRRAVAQTERQYRQLFEGMQEGFALMEMIWDEAGNPSDIRVLEVNPGFERLTGLAAEEVLGRRVREILPRADVGWIARFGPVVQKEEPTTFEIYSEDLDRHYRLSGFRTGENQFAAVAFDVTERNRAQENLRQTATRLRTLADRLTRVREDEREALARELHDVVGASLMGLRMDLEWERSGPPEDEAERRSRLTGLMAAVDHNLELVKEVSSRLRSPILDVMGLGPAIDWMVQEHARRAEMVFHLDLPEAGPDVPADHAIALFRMAQEALQNVLRHSGARNAWVSLALDGSVLTLRVEDDGKGITPEEVRSEKSTGLAGMQERALALGGELSVGTSDEGGTVVEAVVPLRPLRIETRSRRDQAPEDPGVPDPDPEEPNT